MAESFGVEDRGHFYDPVGALRDVVVNHLMQVVAAAAMEPPAGHDAATLKDAMTHAVPRDAGGRPRALRSRPVRRLPRHRRRRRRTPRTETYAALRLEIDNWRWSGVPFFIRTGKCLPVTQTELRLVFHRPPRLGFHARRARQPGARPARHQARPDRPACGCSSRPSAATVPSPEQISLDMEFADEGGEGADARTRCCCTRRCMATARASRARTASRRRGGSCSRCSRRRRRCIPTRRAAGGRRRPTA